MTAAAPRTPGRWSLDSWFSGIRNPDQVEFKAALERDTRALRDGTAGWAGNSAEAATAICALAALDERLWHLAAYLECRSVDDAADEPVKMETSWVATLEAEAVAKQTLGEDVGSVDFWTRGIRAIEPTIAAYESSGRPG